MDEADLRQLLAEGKHREAFEGLVDRFQDKAFHLALSMTHNHSTAADLAQDAFLRVWKALPSYDGRASLSTWIYTITRNVCLTELSRAQRKEAVPLDAPDSAGWASELAAPEANAPGAEMDIDALLAPLSETHRRILRLFYLEGKSYEETAQLLGQPLGTVKTHLFRARQELVRRSQRLANPAHPQPGLPS